MNGFENLDFEKRGGLIPTIVQDDETKDVLMIAYSNPESLRYALEESRGVYWSTSRNEIWRKGDKSGNIQELVEVRYDCDGDALLFSVKQKGPSCHTENKSCFYRRLNQ